MSKSNLRMVEEYSRLPRYKSLFILETAKVYLYSQGVYSLAFDPKFAKVDPKALKFTMIILLVPIGSFFSYT